MAKNDTSTGTAVVAPVAAPAPDFHLIVVHPFGTYAKGAHIKDADEIASVLAGENARSCNKVSPLE